MDSSSFTPHILFKVSKNLLIILSSGNPTNPSIALAPCTRNTAGMDLTYKAVAISGSLSIFNFTNLHLFSSGFVCSIKIGSNFLQGSHQLYILFIN